MFDHCDNEEVAQKLADTLGISINAARALRWQAIRGLATVAVRAENLMEGVWAEEAIRALGVKADTLDILRGLAYAKIS